MQNCDMKHLLSNSRFAFLVLPSNNFVRLLRIYDPFYWNVIPLSETQKSFNVLNAKQYCLLLKMS